MENAEDIKGRTIPETLERSLSLANTLVPKNVAKMFGQYASLAPPTPMDAATADAWLNKNYPARDFPTLYETFAKYSQGNRENRFPIFQGCYSAYTVLLGITISKGVELAGFMVREWDGHFDRIRRCEVCARFFYAYRNNRRTCSPRCKNTRKVRAYRRNRLVYEEARLSASGKVTAEKYKKASTGSRKSAKTRKH